MDEGRGNTGRGGSEEEGEVSAQLESMSVGQTASSIRPKEGAQKGYLAAPKPPPARRDDKKLIEVLFNSWEIKCEDRLVYQYDVSVNLVCRKDNVEKLISLNKGAREDCSVAERSIIIREAVDAGLKHAKILSSSGAHVSNGAALLYANENLQGKLKQYDSQLIVALDILSPTARALIRSPNAWRITLQFGEAMTFNSKDLKGLLNRDRGDVDQTVKSFFDLVTSEDAIRRHTFDNFSRGRLYRADGEGRENAGPGQERRPGIWKGVAPAEIKGGVIAALNLDVTNGTFWKTGPLEQLISEINNWKFAKVWDSKAIRLTSAKLKNLRCSFASRDGQSSWDLVVSGITASVTTTSEGETKTIITTIEQKTYTRDGKQVPLEQKFGGKLKHKDWPLIVSKRPKRSQQDPIKVDIVTEYYPIELLTVKTNQRVPTELHSAPPKSPMRVEERFRQTNVDLEALNLFADTQGPAVNPLLKAFGINVVRKPLRSKAITRAMPTVEAKQATASGARATARFMMAVNDKTSFSTSASLFFSPAHITVLFLAFAEEPRAFRMTQFADFLKSSAARKGMAIDDVQCEIVLPKDLYERLKQIGAEKKEKTEYARRLQRALFLYVEARASESHAKLKLWERRFVVTTQHLTMEVAEKMMGNKPMLENVLMKLNMKGGGHNYSVKPEAYANELWMEKQTMIIGYDVWHPTGSRADRLDGVAPPPSVVGLSFNGGIHPDSFIGDYHYQQARQERVEDVVLRARIQWMMEIFERGRKCLPPLIIVVRDGVSDGQYRYAMDELSTLRQAAREYAVSEKRTKTTGKNPEHNYSPKFIFVVATKRHYRRVYAKEGRDSLPPMSAVDDTITNPALFEFFLQAHYPLKGMAKPTKYTVLKDDKGTSQDAMQALMGALCFEHQVTSNAISIPEPVYQADEWAKRGASNYRTFREEFIDKGLYTMEVTCEGLTSALAYWHSSLERVRVNA